MAEATTTNKSKSSNPLAGVEPGKLTIDDKMRFGPQRMAYSAAHDIASEIASKVSDSTRQKIVVIAGTQLLADFANLEATKLSLLGLQLEYRRIEANVNRIDQESASTADEGALEAVVGVAGAGVVALAAAGTNPFVAAALGVLSLMQSDVEFHGTETPVDRLAFEIDVAAAVKAAGAAKVLIPEFMIRPLADSSSSKLQALLEQVAAAKGDAWNAVAPFIARLTRAEADLDLAVTEKRDAKEIELLRVNVREARRDLEPFHRPLSKADQVFDEMQAQWRKTETGTELSTLARMLRAEAIHAMSPTYLHCAIVASGGHHRIHRHLLRMLFAGDGLTFSGGAVARWALLATDGSIELGGVLSASKSGEH